MKKRTNCRALSLSGRGEDGIQEKRNVAVGLRQGCGHTHPQKERESKTLGRWVEICGESRTIKNICSYWIPFSQ